MNCGNFEEYASLYIDEMLTEEEMINFKKHLETCENCSISLENLKVIVTTVNEMEEVDLPTNFTLSLRERLQIEEKQQKEKKMVKPFYKNWKVLSGVAAGFIILAISLNALDSIKIGQSKSAELAQQNYGMMNKLDVAPTSEALFTGNRGLNKSVELATEDMKDEKEEVSVQFSLADEAAPVELAVDNRKIINTGSIVLETNKFYDVQEKIKNIVETNGGYFQNNNTHFRLLDKERPEESLKSAYLTIRIPSKAFDGVYKELKEIGIVITENQNAEDITFAYRDMENEAMNLEIQEERLREILKKAEKVEDILRIENELSRVRLQINGIKGTLKNYDNLVSLSTINIEVNEVRDQAIKLHTVKEGVWGKAKNNFIKSINQIIYYAEKSFIKFYGLIPWAVILSVILAPIAGIAYKIMKKKQKEE